MVYIYLYTIFGIVKCGDELLISHYQFSVINGGKCNKELSKEWPIYCTVTNLVRKCVYILTQIWSNGQRNIIIVSIYLFSM